MATDGRQLRNGSRLDRQRGALPDDQTTGPDTPSGDGANREPVEPPAVEGLDGGNANDSDIRITSAGRVKPPVQQVVRIRPPDHGPGDDWLRKHFGYLAAYLYDGSWDDIQPRMAGKLTVTCKANVVTMLLQCPTEGQEYAVHASDWLTCLVLLDRACCDPATIWAEMRWGTGVQKKRDVRKKAVDAKNAARDTPS